MCTYLEKREEKLFKDVCPKIKTGTSLINHKKQG